MTPFYEGFTRARQTLRSTERMARPIAEPVVRPRSIGYRVGQGLVTLGAHLMGAHVETEKGLDYELAA